jgi:hypothetical protein
LERDSDKRWNGGEEMGYENKGIGCEKIGIGYERIGKG